MNEVYLKITPILDKSVDKLSDVMENSQLNNREYPTPPNDLKDGPTRVLYITTNQAFRLLNIILKPGEFSLKFSEREQNLLIFYKDKKHLISKIPWEKFFIVKKNMKYVSYETLLFKLLENGWDKREDVPYKNIIFGDKRGGSKKRLIRQSKRRSKRRTKKRVNKRTKISVRKRYSKKKS